MYNILVCDDEKDIVSALNIYLSSEGYDVIPAYSGKQALDILETQHIDLVLMDIMMPEMDGLTAVSKLRETSNVPVLFLTAKSEDADMILVFHEGEIVERGTHEELLEMKGFYYKMQEAQGY